MTQLKHNRYRLVLGKGKITSIIENGKQVRGFSAPVTKNKLPKLYVIKAKGRVAYVGMACQSLRTRLRQGLQASGDHGYHGYKWKALPEVKLLAWCFPDLDSAKVESIEAELVYLVRHKTGRWPEYQMEIHFKNDLHSDKQLRTIIEQMYDQLSNY